MARRTNNEENLQWILKFTNEFPSADLQTNNMRAIRQDQFGQLKQSDELLNALIFTFQGGQLEQQKFVLMPNLLLRVNNTNTMLLPPQVQFQQQMGTASYLSLSECTISQKMVAHKSQQAFSLILTNSLGCTYLVFSNFVNYRLWYKQFKQFCKLTGFLEKYKLGEKIMPGFYTCNKKNKKTQYTVQIYKLDDFEQCRELEDAVHNEIQILRSIKHQSLLELKRVYENQKYLFIVYEFYKGESLFKLLHSNIQLHEVQIASIIYQVLSVLKFLNQHQFYHGSINPQNILINTQHQMLQITLINLSFKEYKVNDKLDWLLNRAVEAFLAPEIFDGIAPNIQTDLYSVGCLLYFMTFYDTKSFEVYFIPRQFTSEDKDFYTIMDNFEVQFEVIQQAEKQLSMRFSQNMTAKPSVSSSQLDLLTKLLETDASMLSQYLDKRMTIKEATKHHWFVNVKNKIKSLKVERKRKKPMPSLRTIIELREQSEMDIRMTIIQQQSGMNAASSRIQLTPQQSHRSIIQSQGQSKLSQYYCANSINLNNTQFDDELDSNNTFLSSS